MHLEPTATDTERSLLREGVLAAHDFSALLGAVAHGVERTFGARVVNARLVMAHPYSPDVRLRVERIGNVTHHRPAAAGKHPIEEFALALSDEVVVSRNVTGWLEEAGLSLPGEHPAAVALIPLRAIAGVNAGAFVLGFDAPLSSFQPNQRLLLHDLRRAAQNVLSTCRELEMLRMTTNNMQEIFEAATMLEGGDDPRTVAQSACEILVERLGFDRSVVTLFNPHETDLVVAGSAGMEGSGMPVRVSLAERKALLATTYREAGVRWLEAHTEPVFADAARGAPRHHAVCLPLLVDGRATGVLYADHGENCVQVSPSRLVSLSLFANNVAARLESARLLSHVGRLADQDPLTGLGNRRAFDSALRREVARAQRHLTPITILMVDIDRFKELNDLHGHLVGDDVLRQTAGLLTKVVREMDFVARFGGDEFVVLMPGAEEAAGRAIRNRILAEIDRQQATLGREKWTFRLSLGVRTASAEDADKLLSEADSALYAHKEAQVRAELLRVLSEARHEDIGRWDHYLGKLLAVLVEKQPGYLRHAREVATTALAVGRALEMTPSELEALHLAAIVHEVGKISIPGVLLNRVSPLSPQEYLTVQSHVRLGEELIREVSYLGDVCGILRSQRERWDGRVDAAPPAFPGELRGAEIPLGARILFAADSFHTMQLERPYRPARSAAQAREALAAESGRAFDPGVVAALFAAHAEPPAAAARKPLNA
ncbi:MAG: diguanylate cyclase [Candidatus Sumerlaeia bacterium]|nr:diguanylate cyclase [Candidatus Sumerlaeia bacterium]